MSWDVIVLDLPPEMTSKDPLPKNYERRPLGSCSDLIAKICAIFPNTDFSDPSYGILRLPGCHIEFDMGMRSAETVDYIAMHVRGGKECPDVVAHILDGLKMRAIDASTSHVFEQDPALRSRGFDRWQSFRSHVENLLDNK
jgi:hypothetical protein